MAIHESNMVALLRSTLPGLGEVTSIKEAMIGLFAKGEHARETFPISFSSSIGSITLASLGM